MSDNPYKSPMSHDACTVTARSPSGWGGREIGISIATIPITLVAWILLVGVLDRRVGAALENWVWSISLMVSIAVSLCLVSKVFEPPRPLTIGCIYAIFSIAYCVLEGSITDGSDASFAIVTMVFVPIFAAAFAFVVRHFWAQNRPCDLPRDG